jgi:hypothetical protein
MPTGINGLSPRSPLLLGLDTLPIHAPYHSIIGDRGRGDTPNSSDGVVAYWSSHLAGARWAFGALWFDFPVSTLRRPLAAVFGLSAIAALAFVRPRWRAQLGVAGAIVLVAAWWLTIRPSNTRDWQPEVAEVPYAEIEGDRVVIHNFRDFDYRSKTDFQPRWETKTVHLSNLRTGDFFTNYNQSCCQYKINGALDLHKPLPTKLYPTPKATALLCRNLNFVANALLNVSGQSKPATKGRN